LVQGDEVVTMVFEVEEFNEFMACQGSAELRSSIEAHVKAGVAYVAGLWTTPANVHVSFPSTSRIVTVIKPAGNVDVATLHRNLQQSKDALGEVMTKHFLEIPGHEATGGASTVTVKFGGVLVRPFGSDSAEVQTWKCAHFGARLQRRRLLVEGPPAATPPAAAGVPGPGPSQLGQGATKCPEGSYQSLAMVLGCGAASVDFAMPLAANEQKEAFTLLKDTLDASFTIAAPLPGSQTLVVLVDKTLGRTLLDPGQEMPRSLKYGGLEFVCPMVGQTVQCAVKGILTSEILVMVKNNRQSIAQAIVQFSYSKIEPCPTLLPGCTALTDDSLKEAQTVLDKWTTRIQEDHPIAADAYANSCDMLNGPTEAGGLSTEGRNSFDMSSAGFPSTAASVPAPTPMSPAPVWSAPAPAPEPILPATSPQVMVEAPKPPPDADVPSWGDVALQAQRSADEAAAAQRSAAAESSIRRPRRLQGPGEAPPHEAVCEHGISWKEWPTVFGSANDTLTRVAFHIWDDDRNGFISQEEFVVAYSAASTPETEATAMVEEEKEKFSGHGRPTLVELQGGDWPDEQALSIEVNVLLIQLWTNVILFCSFGLVCGWPLTRWLANSVLDEIEANLRDQLTQSVRFIADAGNIDKMQQKADVLYTTKEDLMNPPSSCSMM